LLESVSLGPQSVAWLIVMMEEVMRTDGAKDLINSNREASKVLTFRRGGNRDGRFLMVLNQAVGGQRNIIVVPEGREGRGWARFAGELSKVMAFFEAIKELPSSGSILGCTTPSTKVVCEVFVHHGEVRGLDLILVESCRDVEVGRMAVNCFDLDAQSTGPMKKKMKLGWTHGGGEVRKKKQKLGYFGLWRKLLEWIRAALDWVSTSGSRHIRLRLKPKLCKIGETNVAIELLKMEEANLEFGVVHYTTIIDSLFKDKLVTKALNFFSKMTNKGIQPNLFTYTSLIQGLCDFRNWKEVTTLLKEMVHRKIMPDVTTFNILITALCEEGKLMEAKEAFDVMVQRGMEPDTVTYNSLIDGYCLQTRMDDAVKTFNMMVEKSCSPSVISYSILINGYCKNRRIDEAMSLFHEMSNKGVNPNVSTYTTLIGGLCQLKRHQAAQELLPKMQTSGEYPDLLTYSLLLNGLFKNKFFF
jgi:pentatricopeptide repeat protein